jgi:hypothetical protein
MGDILALPHIEKVRTLPPTSTRSTRIRITLVGGVYSDFTISEARELLAAEKVWESKNA